jgi:hypothetical protein
MTAIYSSKMKIIQDMYALLCWRFFFFKKSTNPDEKSATFGVKAASLATLFIARNRN